MPVRQTPPKCYVNWSRVPVLITAAELAVLLSGNEKAVRRLLVDGEIPGAKKVGGKWLIERDTFRRHFEGDYSPPQLSDADAGAIASLIAEKLARSGYYHK